MGLCASNFDVEEENKRTKQFEEFRAQLKNIRLQFGSSMPVLVVKVDLPQQGQVEAFGRFGRENRQLVCGSLPADIVDKFSFTKVEPEF